MAKAEIILGEGSGANITLDAIEFTNKTLLGSITSRSESFTASEDCIMGGIITGSSSAYAYVNFDNSLVFASNSTARIGCSSSSVTNPDTYGMFVPKGTVVTVRSDSGTYNIKFYSLN